MELGVAVAARLRDDRLPTASCARKGAVGGVDQRGGAPGTRETDLLNPINLVEKSMRWCWQAGRPSGWILPAA